MDETPPTLLPSVPESGGKRRRRKRWAGGVGVLMLLVLGLVAALPMLLSTGVGNRWLLSRVNGWIPGEVSADAVAVGWLGGTSLRNVTLRDARGAAVVEGLSVEAAGLGVWDALRQKDLGEVVVSVRSVEMVQLPGERSNLEEALGLSGGKSEAPSGDSRGGWVVPPDLGLRLLLEADRVSYRSSADPGGGESLSVLRDLKLAVDVSDLSAITASATSAVERDGVAGVLEMDLEMRDAVDASGRLDFAGAVVRGGARVRELPVGPVDRLLGYDGKLLATLGPWLSVETSARMEAGDAVVVEGTVASEGVSGPFVVRLGEDGRRGELAMPADWGVWLSPAVLRAWLGSETYDGLPVRLDQPTQASLRVEKLVWTFEESAGGGWAIVPAKSSVAARVRLPRLELKNTAQGAAGGAGGAGGVGAGGASGGGLPALVGFRTRVEAADLSQAWVVRGGVDLEVQAPGDAPGPAGVTWRATGTGMFSEAGGFDARAGVFEAEVSGRGLPTALVDALLKQDGQLLATLGPVITPKAAVVVTPGREATADVEIDSTQASGVVRLTEDLSDEVWSPVLREDVVLTLAVSEGAVKAWMGSLHPVFADVLRSAEGSPAVLRVSKADFALSPEGAFDLKQVEAEAALSLGVMEMDRQGWLRQGVTGLVRQVMPGFRREQAGRTYLAKFSPMQIRVKDGVVETSEMWLAAEDFGVGFSGRINLNDQTLDMGVGVLGATFIATASDLGKVFEPGKVYELPIEGSVGSPTMGYGRLVGQVATMYGQRELLNNDDLGGLGKVLGDWGGELLRDAMEWENPRSWSPSEEALGFATGISEAQREKFERAAQAREQARREQAEGGGESEKHPGEHPGELPGEEPGKLPGAGAGEEDPSLEDQLEEAGVELLRDLLGL